MYFTDGNGEAKLLTVPKGYQILWVISGKGDTLSLQQPYGVVKKLAYQESIDAVLDGSDVEKGGFSMNNQERLGI